VKLSIIVPSFNQGRFLDETIRSIVTQGWPDLELIVIDGGSTDETLDVIRKHEPSIAYWISEPDRGQADAINKGLRRATGDVVTWFGADDLYADGIFAALEPAWRRNPRAIYAAPVANFYSRGRQILLRPHGLTLANVIQYWQRRSLWHDPGLFWSRAVIDALATSTRRCTTPSTTTTSSAPCNTPASNTSTTSPPAFGSTATPSPSPRPSR